MPQDWLSGLTVVDMVLIVILALALMIGWARGFVEVLAGFAIYLVSTLIAGRYSGVLVGWVDRTWGAENWLTDLLLRKVHFPPAAYAVPASAVPPSMAAAWVQDLPLPAPARAALAHHIMTWAPHAGRETVAAFLARQMAAGILSAVAFAVLVMLLVTVLSYVARAVSRQIKEIPLVGGVNGALGAVVYLAETVLTLALLVSLAVPALSLMGWKGLDQAVHQAKLTPYLLAVLDYVKGWFFGDGRGFFFGF